MLANLPSYPIVSHPGHNKLLIPTTPLDIFLGCFPNEQYVSSTHTPFNAHI